MMALFANDKEFWSLHFVGWSAVLLFSAGVATFGLVPLVPTLSGVLAYAMFSTCFCLLFARCFRLRRWFELTIGRQFVWTLCFSMPAGVVVGYIFAAAIHVLQIDTYGSKLPLSPALSPQDVFLLTAGNNAAIFTFLMLFWGMLYIGVYNYRRATASDRKSMLMERDLKEATLNLLSGQLKPHFLFNALNNIRFMMKEDIDRAADMLVALSEILRYSLEAGSLAKVPVEEELHIVDQYIALVTLQFDAKLKFQVSIAPECRQALIPPMMLQLLIENAVKHGIDSNYREGQLLLSGESGDDRIAFSIVNDTSASVGASFCKTNGVGLTNIRQRLSLLYGENGTLKIEQNREWVTATLSLPMERQS